MAKINPSATIHRSFDKLELGDHGDVFVDQRRDFGPRLVGGDYRRVLPLSALLGAVFPGIADIVARTTIPPLDMPIGVITGLVGRVFFIGLMRHNGRLG